MNIYISGLNFNTTDADLSDLFQSTEKFLLQESLQTEKQEDPEVSVS